MAATKAQCSRSPWHAVTGRVISWRTVFCSATQVCTGDAAMSLGSQAAVNARYVESRGTRSAGGLRVSRQPPCGWPCPVSLWTAVTGRCGCVGAASSVARSYGLEEPAASAWAEEELRYWAPAAVIYSLSSRVVAKAKVRVLFGCSAAFPGTPSPARRPYHPSTWECR